MSSQTLQPGDRSPGAHRVRRGAAVLCLVLAALGAVGIVLGSAAPEGAGAGPPHGGDPRHPGGPRHRPAPGRAGRDPERDRLHRARLLPGDGPLPEGRRVRGAPGRPAPGRPPAPRDRPGEAAPPGAARGLHDPGAGPADRGRGHRPRRRGPPHGQQRPHGLEPRHRVRLARGVPLPRHLPGHQGHARGGDPGADGPALPGPVGHGRRHRARPASAAWASISWSPWRRSWRRKQRWRRSGPSSPGSS